MRRISERTTLTQSEIIRDALSKYVEQVERTGLRSARVLPSGVGRYSSGRSDVSEGAEDILRNRFRGRAE